MPRLIDFFRTSSTNPETEFDPRQTSVPDLLNEYEQFFRDLLAQSGVKGTGIEFRSRHVGQGPDQLPVVVVALRIVSWDARSTPKVLLGLPLLQRAAQKALLHSWLADASHFGGLWVHVSSALDIPSGESCVLKEAIAA